MSNSSARTLSPNHYLRDHKFYVAATLQDLDKARSMIDALTAVGMRCAYDWAAIGFVDVSEYPDCAEKEIAGVIASSVFVGILPGKFGMQTECGAALALNIVQPRRISILVSETDQYWRMKHSEQSQFINVFWHHPLFEKLVGDDINQTVIDYIMSYN